MDLDILSSYVLKVTARPAQRGIEADDDNSKTPRRLDEGGSLGGQSEGSRAKWDRRSSVAARIAWEHERESCCCVTASRIHILMIFLQQLGWKVPVSYRRLLDRISELQGGNGGSRSCIYMCVITRLRQFGVSIMSLMTPSWEVSRPDLNMICIGQQLKLYITSHIFFNQTTRQSVQMMVYMNSGRQPSQVCTLVLFGCS